MHTPIAMVYARACLATAVLQLAAAGLLAAAARPTRPAVGVAIEDLDLAKPEELSLDRILAPAAALPA